MARSFASGLIWGAVVVGVGLVAFSVLAPPPSVVEKAQVTGVADGLVGRTVAPATPSAGAAALTPIEPLAQGKAPAAQADADTAPATAPPAEASGTTAPQVDNAAAASQAVSDEPAPAAAPAHATPDVLAPLPQVPAAPVAALPTRAAPEIAPTVPADSSKPIVGTPAPDLTTPVTTAQLQAVPAPAAAAPTVVATVPADSSKPIVGTPAPDLTTPVTTAQLQAVLAPAADGANTESGVAQSVSPDATSDAAKPKEATTQSTPTTNATGTTQTLTTTRATLTTEAATAETVTAETVTAETVTAETVTAETVIAEAATTEAATTGTLTTATATWRSATATAAVDPAEAPAAGKMALPPASAAKVGVEASPESLADGTYQTAPVALGTATAQALPPDTPAAAEVAPALSSLDAVLTAPAADAQPGVVAVPEPAGPKDALLQPSQGAGLTEPARMPQIAAAEDPNTAPPQVVATATPLVDSSPVAPTAPLPRVITPQSTLPTVKELASARPGMLKPAEIKPSIPGVQTDQLPQIGAAPKVDEKDMAALPQIGTAAANSAIADQPITMFARKFDGPVSKPMFVILLRDVGGAGMSRDDLAKLPFPVSFVVDPLATDAKEAAFPTAPQGKRC